jgi:DNA-binding response OmpR family regulator
MEVQPLTEPYYGVLVIDENPDQASLFAEAARLAHMPVEIVEDGRSALERLAEITPRVVILDLNLPNVPGESIVKFLRSNGRFSDTRVFATSSDAERVTSVASQVDLTIVKPISYANLHALVTKL